MLLPDTATGSVTADQASAQRRDRQQRLLEGPDTNVNRSGPRIRARHNCANRTRHIAGICRRAGACCRIRARCTRTLANGSAGTHRAKTACRRNRRPASGSPEDLRHGTPVTTRVVPIV